MKKILFGALFLLIGQVCHAEDITIRYNGSSAKVKQTTKDSDNVTVKTKGYEKTFTLSENFTTIR